MNSVEMICNETGCFFIANYHQTTLESVIEHRKYVKENSPNLDGECPHTDVSYQVMGKKN